MPSCPVHPAYIHSYVLLKKPLGVYSTYSTTFSRLAHHGEFLLGFALGSLTFAADRRGNYYRTALRTIIQHAACISMCINTWESADVVQPQGQYNYYHRDFTRLHIIQSSSSTVKMSLLIYIIFYSFYLSFPQKQETRFDAGNDKRD